MAIGRFQRALAGVLISSATYGIVYFLLLSFALTLGVAELAADSPLLAVRDTLMFLTTVFGFPFMPSLTSSAPLTWPRQVFGNDSGAIIGLIALNSLLWGPLLFFGFRMIRARIQRGAPRSLVLSILWLIAPIASARGQDRYAQVVRAILDAWKTADVVCLGEDHGRYYDSALRIALVSHPDFPRIVRVIVIESGNPTHQDILDRFVLEGAEMSREELAPVWRDASGAEVWESPIYEQFLRAVRQVNLGLPPAQRVRVLGGDSPIDWSRITKPGDLVPLVNRGGNIRNIIAQQVLDVHRKGLAIYGAGHCTKVGGGFPGELAGKYQPSRFWSIWSLGRKGVQRGVDVFGLGRDPAYVVVNGTKWDSLPAADFLEGETSRLGGILDAIVYHGEVPDSVVRADLTAMNAAYGPELQRRRGLIQDALKLWLHRP